MSVSGQQETQACGFILGARYGSRRPTFSDPFVLPSSDTFPLDLRTALDLALYLYYKTPLYVAASRRIVGHFITDLDFPEDDADAELKRNLEDELLDNLKIKAMLNALGDEGTCYGNGFMRLVTPFRRVLEDRRHGRTKQYDVENFPNAKFHLQEMQYEIDDPSATNPAKRGKIRLPFRDYPVFDPSRMQLKLLDPRYVRLRTPHYGGPTQVIWKMEQWFRQTIKDGELYQVNYTPRSVLEAIKSDQDYLFNEGEVFHLAYPAPTGISDQGWGMPPTIANYHILRQIQIYNKIDESLAQDYMLPFRVFSPAFNTEHAANFLTQVDGGEWKREISGMVDRRRADMYSFHAFPFPFDYKELGADGKVLTPVELQEYQQNNLLDALGYPAQLFRGSMHIEQMPAAVRIFESAFQFLKDGLEGAVCWAGSRAQKYLSRPVIKVGLKPTRLADDLELRHIRLQLGAAGEISRATSLAGLGIDDPVAEQLERHEEDLSIEEGRMDKQEEFERRLMAGTVGDAVINIQQQQMQEMGLSAGPAAGAIPPGGTVSPVQMEQQAHDIALKLLQIEHDGDRRKELDALRHMNPTLHALVKEHMERERNQAAAAGRQQAGQI